MPDEIIPRDRAELLWDAIINHTIEAVDAIRDRPELIAAAIAAGLPDMLGNPRDRYEMFLKAIAGAQGGDYKFQITDISSPGSWLTPYFPNHFNSGGYMEIKFEYTTVPSDRTEVLLDGGIDMNIGQVNSTTTIHVKNVIADGALSLNIWHNDGVRPSNKIDVTVPADISTPHILKVSDKIYLDDQELATLPDTLMNSSVIRFGSGQSGTSFSGKIDYVHYKE